MLAQLKTVVLINEANKMAFFRLVEYLEHQHLWVRGVGGPGAQLSKRTSTLECLV
jgi:hypothetical protein